MTTNVFATPQFEAFEDEFDLDLDFDNTPVESLRQALAPTGDDVAQHAALAPQAFQSQAFQTPAPQTQSVQPSGPAGFAAQAPSDQPAFQNMAPQGDAAPSPAAQAPVMPVVQPAVAPVYEPAPTPVASVASHDMTSSLQAEVSVPRIAIHVLAELQDTLASADRAGRDRRLSRATAQFRVGGVPAAIEA